MFAIVYILNFGGIVSAENQLHFYFFPIPGNILLQIPGYSS